MSDHTDVEGRARPLPAGSHQVRIEFDPDCGTLESVQIDVDDPAEELARPVSPEERLAVAMAGQ